VRSPERVNELVDRAIKSLESAEDWGLAPHTLFTASGNLYRRCEEIARRENALLTTHLAESREETSMFRDESGRLYEFMKSIGRPMDDCGQGTPLQRFLTARDSSTTLRSARNDNDWLVAHLNELTKSDFELLEKSNMQFHVVHSPRSHDYFAHSAFAFERLHDLGFNICLGTDSLASNENLSLFAEMRAFRRGEPAISPKEALEMVTVNGGRALGRPQTLGRIRANYFADLVAIPCSGTADVFEEILAFDQPVHWIMVNGKT
jgi:cytosine/adenosine deaminase-related metal-dependent hydrolase